MKKILCFVLILMMCLALYACATEKSQTFDLSEELIKEKWVAIETGDGTFSFYKTGTGRFESSMATFDFTWEKLEDYENCIRMTYQFVIGANSSALMTDAVTDYELVIEDGVFHLNMVGEGYNYIRISDYNK